MRKALSFLRYWGPVILWMWLVFTASGTQGSFQQSSRLLAPILRWLFPTMSETAIFDIVLGVRKCAHVSEYGLLFLLVWRARRRPFRGDARPWKWSEAAEAMWITVLYATSDEFHQTYIPVREGCLRDVLIDTSGAIGGMLLLRIVGGKLRLWSRRGDSPVTLQARESNAPGK